MVNFTIVGLLVIGGIGFVVQYEIFSRLRGRQKRLSVHTKIVLITTALLLVGGAVLFYLFEKDFILREASRFRIKILASIFQSASPRTCGYNTVDIGALTNRRHPSDHDPDVHRRFPGFHGGRGENDQRGPHFSSDLEPVSRARGSERL